MVVKFILVIKFTSKDTSYSVEYGIKRPIKLLI